MSPLFVCFLLLLARQALGDEKSDLFEMQQTSSDGVISFNPGMFEKYAAGKSRPYSLIFCLLADQLMDQPKLALKKLREEFGICSKAYKEKYSIGSRTGKVFFVTMEVGDSANLFQRLGAQSLPFVFRLSPHSVVGKTGKIEIPDGEMMTFKDSAQYPWRAEAFAEFVKIRTGVAVDEIPRNDALGTRLTVLIFILSLSTAVWTARRLYDTPFIQSKWIWLAGTLFVCWFSTSGAMFNIIRGVPFALPKDGKLQLMYPGNGQQLGAEGFIMGSMYIVFSGMFAVVTYGIPRVHNATSRRILLLASVIGAVFILRNVIHFYAMKTGYRLRQYIF
eukprot:g6319.t1